MLMIVSLKKMSCLLLCIMLVASVGSVAFAAESDSTAEASAGNTMVLRWSNTSSVNVNLSFINGKGALGANVIGKPGATNITGTAVLAMQNSNGTYTTVKTWDNLSSANNILTFNATYYVTTGYHYRLTVTATVYRNGTYENVSGVKETTA